MTDALEGPPAHEPTLREQANWPRIGRARFIGNAVGVLLLVALAEFALGFAGLRETRLLGSREVMLPNRWVGLGGSVVLFLALVDLAVRRRHDRGRNGADTVALLFLLALIHAGVLFGVLASIPAMAVGAVGGLAVLYLLVVLALLPGNKGANGYGPDPRLP